MAKRRWTVVFVPHDSEPSKIVEVSYRVIKAAIGGAVLAAGAALALGYVTLTRTVDMSQSAQLAHENARLEQQLGELNGRLSGLADTLTRISQRDARIRVLANLDPIDPQVQAAGIGGPTVASAGADVGSAMRRSNEIRVDLNALIRRANLLATSFKEAADSLSVHSARLSAKPSIMPTQGWLSSAFSSMRAHPILHTARPHEGIDVTAPMGTPIEAPAAGAVRAAGWEPGYGNTIVIDHGFGTVTKFAHASKILVREGQRVSRGQRIALVGNTGLATGPHLHYEVHVNGRAVDPLRYVLPEHVVTD
jgi:murein DD-endopeptidase MepM/ murein hydrolase activator NlpD